MRLVTYTAIGIALALTTVVSTWMVPDRPDANSQQDRLRQENAEIRVLRKNAFNAPSTIDNSSGRQNSQYEVINDAQVPTALWNPSDEVATIEGREIIGSGQSAVGSHSIGPDESFENTIVLSSGAGEGFDYFDSIEPDADESFENTVVFLPEPGDGLQDIDSFGDEREEGFEAYGVFGPGPGENSLGR